MSLFTEFQNKLFSVLFLFACMFHHCGNTLICHEKTFQHIVFMLLNICFNVNITEGQTKDTVVMVIVILELQ